MKRVLTILVMLSFASFINAVVMRPHKTARSASFEALSQSPHTPEERIAVLKQNIKDEHDAVNMSYKKISTWTGELALLETQHNHAKAMQAKANSPKS